MKKYLIKIAITLSCFLAFNCNLVKAQSPPPQKKKIKIEHLKIEGSSFTDEITSILAPYLNQEIKRSEISIFLDIINQFYQNQGYFLSFAIIPLQDMEDGVLLVRVNEGKISYVEVDGNSALSDNYIKNRLKKSLFAVPFNVKTLGRELQLLQQNSNIEGIRAELRPDLELGNSGIKLIVSESPTTTISISADNDFAPSSGNFGGGIALEKRSLLTGGDEVQLESTFTPGLEKYEISYGIPINSADGMVTLGYKNSQSNIKEEPFNVLDISIEIEQFGIFYRQPLFRTLTKEIISFFSFDVTSVNSFIFDGIPFPLREGSEDGFYRVSALGWGLIRQTRGTSEVLILSSQFSLGLDIFGATNNNNLPDGQFFIWRGQGRWVKALDSSLNTLLVLNFKAQISSESILPSEQFVTGGIDSVRGYRENLLATDNGINGSIELRIPLFNSQSLGLLQLTPFFDFGRGWNDLNNLNSRTLASVGLGILWTMNDTFTLSINRGFPLVPVAPRGDSLSENGWHIEVKITPIRF